MGLFPSSLFLYIVTTFWEHVENICSAYCVPDTVLNALHVLIYLNFITGRYFVGIL